jgi:hypothetical protein
LEATAALEQGPLLLEDVGRRGLGGGTEQRSEALFQRAFKPIEEVTGS